MNISNQIFWKIDLKLFKDKKETEVKPIKGCDLGKKYSGQLGTLLKSLYYRAQY